MKNADVLLLLQEKLPYGEIVDWYETIGMILENLPGQPEFDIVEDEFVVSTGNFSAAFRPNDDGFEIRTISSFGTDRPSGYRIQVHNDLQLVRAMEALYNKAQTPEFKPQEMSSLDRYYSAGATMKDVPRIVIGGRIYKQAQLQELLSQYESASGKIIKTLTDAHKAALGKDFAKANKTLESLNGVLDKSVLEKLTDLNDTMAGVVGLEGK